MRLKGIGASPGIQFGKVLLLSDKKITPEKIINLDASKEMEKLDGAIIIAKKQVEELKNRATEIMGEEKAKIFDAHLLMLDDSMLFNQVKDKIKSNSINAEWALKEVTDTFLAMFESMADEYMKERAADLNDISQRLFGIMLGIEQVDLSNLTEEVIIVAKDMFPSDTAKIDKEKVIAFVTEEGGRTSHTAIMAKTLGIPAVVGVNGLLAVIKTGDNVIINGEAGEVLINPNEDEISKYNEEKRIGNSFIKILESYKDSASISKDGAKVDVAANIGKVSDVEGALKNGAEGIGLFRSEFLYMDRNSFPTEEEQFEAYKEVAEKMKGKPVVIRTLDIGGDKALPYFQLPKEDNPFLGYRAIRLCLDRKDIFVTQLRALLRASFYGNIKIMFPMISSMEEVLEAKGILEGVKETLREEKIEFNDDIEVGIMIEIPTAAVLSDFLAKEVDFFSIGTNDLIQYMTAVDRMNAKVSHLYNQYHPSVLRLIKQVIDNAHKEGIWVGMCGETASESKLIPLFLGMGLDEFSMSSGSILKARWIVNNSSKNDMGKLVDRILKMPTAVGVEKALEENLQQMQQNL